MYFIGFVSASCIFLCISGPVVWRSRLCIGSVLFCLWGKVEFVERRIFLYDIVEVGKGVLTSKYPGGYFEAK